MKLKIGTDCSGIEAPIQALLQLGIKFDHKFSSDIDKYARQSIEANYEPDTLFNDMTEDRKLPEVDIYVCGFPCQPFSTLGKRKGSRDPRGNIFLHCIEAIKKSKPILFILENVRGIITIEKGSYFSAIREQLGQLVDYEVHYWILNTKNYGIPQNRERLYIIGIKKEKLCSQLDFPETMECEPVENFIDYGTTCIDEYSPTYQKKYDQFKDATFVCLSSLYLNGSKVNPLYSSTIVASHATWCIPMHRKATIKECLQLQGFPITFKQVVSDTQMRRQIGNSMSVNVLMVIFDECFRSIEF